MREFNVNNKYSNLKIETVLIKLFPALSCSSLNKLFRLKDIKVNNIRVSKGYVVSVNDNIKIYARDDVLLGINNINICYEDENILIAYKPKKIISCSKKEDDNFSFEYLVKKK